MGSFYGNVSVRGVGRDDVISQLRLSRTSAWVGPAQGGWTVFSDPETDRQNFQSIYPWMLQVGAAPRSLAIAAAVHDSDILLLFAVAGGRVIFRYDSCPDYFDRNGTTRAPPIVEGEDGLLAAVGSGVDATALHDLLWRPDSFVFADQLHAAFAGLIGSPQYAASFGYRYSEDGELPGEPQEFTRVDG